MVNTEVVRNNSPVSPHPQPTGQYLESENLKYNNFTQYDSQFNTTMTLINMFL